MTEQEEDLGKCLVIGGAGMLGFEIVSQLHLQGHFVRVLDLEPISANGIDSIIGDIRNLEDVEKACEGIDTVFQTAATVWNPRTPSQMFDDVNVKGNQNVIDTCLKFNIPRLIYTSTLDVVVDGKKPIVYGDETLPYPSKMPKDHYSRTKIIAEKDTIEVNGKKYYYLSYSYREGKKVKQRVIYNLREHPTLKPVKKIREVLSNT